MDNNDILKKLRVALQLRNDDIIEILKLVDFEITKGALGDFFRNPSHPNYMEAQDQVLRNFLNTESHAFVAVVGQRGQYKGTLLANR